MKNINEIENQTGRQGDQAAAERLERLADKLLEEAREALLMSNGEVRRRIVRTALSLERMLGEVRP